MKPGKRQIKLTIASNAGGSGKTTVAAHLAYIIGAKGYSVILIELDYNGSISTFTGTHKPTIADETVGYVLSDDFSGNYPLFPAWEEYTSNVKVIRGGSPSEEGIKGIYMSDRRYYVMRDRLEDYPLDADLIIFDTPATLEPAGLLAMVASTHILAPIKPEFKDTASLANFLQWYYEKTTSLRLRPKPEMLGFVPTRVDLSGIATHRNILGLDKKGKMRSDIPPEETLPFQIQNLGITCFPYIRESNYYLQASGAGLPLHLYRPGYDYSKDFEPIANQLVKLMTEED
jgi:chromosome partitioning protein